MVLKLDLTKAYDRLEWLFIQKTLLDAGLPPNLVIVIMNCITSGNCKVLWNGEAIDPIHPNRRLRQGDPLSPYIFVLCTERLAQWIELKKLSHEWKPLKASRRGPCFSHLFFDDLLLFVEATMEQAVLIKQGLDLFCNASGQQISFAKSSLFFSPNVAEHLACRISTTLGIPRTDD